MLFVIILYIAILFKLKAVNVDSLWVFLVPTIVSMGIQMYKLASVLSSFLPFKIKSNKVSDCLK